jgi:hypothetical protein
MVRFHPDLHSSSYVVPLGDNQWIQIRAADLDILSAALHHLHRTR